MEGVSNEAASLAGHWGLGKLIAFYDDNQISIDGNTDISFTEDVSARYEALGWHVMHVKVRTAMRLSLQLLPASLACTAHALNPLEWSNRRTATPTLTASATPSQRPSPSQTSRR